MHQIPEQTGGRAENEFHIVTRFSEGAKILVI